MRNLLFEQKKAKIIKWMALCGRENRDYAACLKDEVSFLFVQIYNNMHF